MTLLLPDLPGPLAGGEASVEGEALGWIDRGIEGLRARAGVVDPVSVTAAVDRRIRQLEALKLTFVARADQEQVAARTGMSDTSAWLAKQTNADSAKASRKVRLAQALSTNPAAGRPSREPGFVAPPRRPVEQANAAGELTEEQVQVIVHAIDQLPTGVTAEQVTVVETDLVAKAQKYPADQLRRIARRALAAVEPDETVVDAHEDKLLRDEETSALAKTRLTLHDNGDGTMSGHFTVPTLAAAILTRVIHSMTAPRRARLGASNAQAGDPAQRRDFAHTSGLAFLELLEHLPTDHLHTKTAATIVVTIDETTLRERLKAAHLDTGEDLSTSQARRIACNAGILPAVLNGQSLPLDLGREKRLFSETQRVALATRHSTCAADGCQRPYSWCELHHRQPWSHGGTTNLTDAIPLCAFHHQRIHDPAYHHTTTPDGITFHQRR